MAESAGQSGPFRTSELSQSRPTRFSVEPGEAARAAIAEELGLSALRKLAFSGEIRPEGKRGFQLTGKLGATVVQPCVVTLAPVTTRIETQVTRTYLPEAQIEMPEAGAEVEMPEDETVEAIGEEIAPEAVMFEALSLSVPEYPRAAEAELVQTTAEPEGAAPITDEDLKPFAGLAGLRDKMSGGSNE
ncbi:hypothetical protein OCH239_21630 [Roseivivax halodurans JCM 10272]|uniref:50S ribosomal protein L34 n=1 Tax=Roseivivax halodurans JCM 10272 TaxID=1449350 RepID=X7EET7_9RHOB|nr:DUF177 domain-containing protein [Roseivivax halodurans]ETX14609.1 hypothetical protein OCH239_21630 [Roseivivax halodurans JCM 10272]